MRTSRDEVAMKFGRHRLEACATYARDVIPSSAIVAASSVRMMRVDMIIFLSSSTG